MIYTVTLNPSLDYVMDVADFAVGAINRSSQEQIFPGGKGINVSQVLRELSMDNTAVYFAADFTGRHLTELLEAGRIRTRVIDLDEGMTRINVKMRAGDETAINAAGPPISDSAMRELYDTLSAVREGDVVVLSGNVPQNIPADVYTKIGAIVKEKRAEFVLDATGDALVNGLAQQPLFIKPNHEELGEILGREIADPEAARAGAAVLRDKGAKIVLVSMGAQGALLLWHDGTAYYGGNPDGKVKNTVGAGDSMVAGFLTGILQELGPTEALRLGIASGSATALSDGLATAAHIRELKDKITIQQL